MAHDIGYVDNTGSEGVAHWQMLLKIKTLAEANGWTTLRYLNPTPYTDNTVIRELILQGVGLSGTEQIFIGFRAYQDQSANYYNLSVAGFTGYVAAQSFTTQPGYREMGVCAHNERIDYWLAVNAQRIMFALKVGAPSAYEVGYAGKFFPYGTPQQYPYPLAVIGTLNGVPATRYDSTTSTHSCGVKGSLPQGAVRDVMGNWNQFANLPFYTSATVRRDTGGYYNAVKSVLFNTNQVWGELDGICYISGFNNAAENTATIDGKLNVVVGDCFRTGIGDYFLLEMN